MTEQSTTNEEPAIPWLVKRWKERKLRKKMDDIEMLQLKIVEAGLQKELREIK